MVQHLVHLFLGQLRKDGAHQVAHAPAEVGLEFIGGALRQLEMAHGVVHGVYDVLQGIHHRAVEVEENRVVFHAVTHDKSQPRRAGS